MPQISVVVPLYNAEPHLELVLPPLEAALRRGEVREVIVVDDSSTDGGAAECRRRGLTIIESGGRLGPAACRNLGAEAARGDVLLFVDSDVVLHREAARIVAEGMTDPEVVAVFGSYDDRPAAPGLVSQFRNLLHHHVHQCGELEASTFWAGIGAVRRDVFHAIGGFDARRYPRPAVEDIELGGRLTDFGRIVLLKDLLGTHLKRWSFAQMVHTDLFARAIPWSRLLLAGHRSERALNLRRGERFRAGLAGLFWLSAGMAVGSLLAGRTSLSFASALVFAGVALVGAAAHWPFLILVWSRLGRLQTLPALALLQVYYGVATAGYLYCRLELVLARIRRGAFSGQVR